MADHFTWRGIVFTSAPGNHWFSLGGDWWVARKREGQWAALLELPGADGALHLTAGGETPEAALDALALSAANHVKAAMAALKQVKGWAEILPAEKKEGSSDATHEPRPNE